MSGCLEGGWLRRCARAGSDVRIRTVGEESTHRCEHSNGERALGKLAAATLRALGKHDADDEHRERAPLIASEGLPQNHHAKDGGGESLRLIEQLQQCSAEVRSSNKLEVVLQRVAEGGDRNLERVEFAFPDELTQLPYRGHGAARDNDQRQRANKKLEQLREEHSH